MDDDLVDGVGGGGAARLARYFVEEVGEDDKEEEELSLVCSEWRCKGQSEALSLDYLVRMVKI